MSAPAPDAILFRNLTDTSRHINDGEMHTDIEALASQLYVRLRANPHEEVAGVLGLPADEWFAITLKDIETLDESDDGPDVAFTAKVQPLAELPAVQAAFCDMIRDRCVGGVQ